MYPLLPRAPPPPHCSRVSCCINIFSGLESLNRDRVCRPSPVPYLDVWYKVTDVWLAPYWPDIPSIRRPGDTVARIRRRGYFFLAPDICAKTTMARNKIWIDSRNVELILTVSQFGSISRDLFYVTYKRRFIVENCITVRKRKRQIVYYNLSFIYTSVYFKSRPQIFSRLGINWRLSESEIETIF